MPKYGPPGILRLQELPDPRPGPGEVLVRVRAIGLNFADCAARLGVYPRVPKPPFVPGMEVSGEVAALGDGVDGPPIGTPVAAVPIFGGHAELVVVKAQSLRTMAGSIDFVTAAAVAVTSLTADHALFAVGRLRAGERIAVTAAAGGVGTMAVQMAAAATASACPCRQCTMTSSCWKKTRCGRAGGISAAGRSASRARRPASSTSAQSAALAASFAAVVILAVDVTSGITPMDQEVAVPTRRGPPPLPGVQRCDR